MHLLLTDRLCCPRCGPEFGLILLANRLEDRRVYEGGLGCANCRDSYPIRDGVGDLRPAPRAKLALVDASDDWMTSPPDQANPLPSAAEIGGLLGVLRGPGHLLVAGSLTARATALATLIEGIEVVAASPGAPPGTENVGVSRAIIRSRLPFQSGSLRGAAIRQVEDTCDLSEAARVVAPGSRLVIFATLPGAADQIRALGLEIIAEEESRLVARR